MSGPPLSKHGVGIAIALAAAGAGSYLLFGFLPQRAELAELRKEAREKRVAAAQAASAPAQIAESAESIFAAKRCIAAWSAAAPRQEALVMLFRDINQIAQSSQARNLRLEPEPIETMGAIWRAPVQLVIEGSFSQLFEFIRGAESLSPGIHFSSLQVERSDETTQILRMTATLTVFGAQPEFSDYAKLAE